MITSDLRRQIKGFSSSIYQTVFMIIIICSIAWFPKSMHHVFSLFS